MSPFGAELRRLRHARQLTLAALGQQVGVAQAYLSQLEHGRSRPSAELVERLAHALDSDPASFHVLAGTTPPEPPASELAALLLHVRQQRGWRQADLADRLGIDRAYLSRLERGHDTPSDALLQTLAAQTDLPLDAVRRAAKRVDTAALLARAAEVDGLRDMLAAIPLLSVADLEALVQCWRDRDADHG